MADALGETTRLAAEQCYNFKPIWPASEAEAADLEQRAKQMQAGRPDPGPRRGMARDEADGAAGDARLPRRTAASSPPHRVRPEEATRWRSAPPAPSPAPC